eukprot:1195463-Prorocentrum_minimum.AAC.1
METLLDAWDVEDEAQLISKLDFNTKMMGGKLFQGEFTKSYVKPKPGKLNIMAKSANIMAKSAPQLSTMTNRVRRKLAVVQNFSKTSKDSR